MLLPLSFGVCPQGAREMMLSRFLSAASMQQQTCSDSPSTTLCRRAERISVMRSFFFCSGQDSRTAENDSSKSRFDAALPQTDSYYSQIQLTHLLALFPFWRPIILRGVALLRLAAFPLARMKNPLRI